MKKIKYQFNELLFRYNRYLKKLQRLQLLGRNKHRQTVLLKHIFRIKIQLQKFQLRINRKIAYKGILATLTITTGQAQEVFDTPILNPFGIEIIDDDVSTAFSRPVYADFDADGDLDMFSGSGFNDNFSYYENVGTAQEPSFEEPIINPFGIDTSQFNYYIQTPIIVDIDGDGDFDLISVTNYSDFLFFENIGTSQEPNFDTVQIDPFGIGFIGSYSGPTFVDIDGDGDFDLFDNSLFFENIGSATDPIFAPALEGAFGIENIDGSSLGFGDLDNDGDLDLISGGFYGGLFYFENIGTVNSPNFTVPIEGFLGLDLEPPNSYAYSYSSPTFVDLDSDGDLDVMSGEFNGIFFYFENIPDSLGPTPDLDELPDINAQCEVTSLTPPTATDNTGLDVTVTNDAVLPITDQGTIMVTWTFTDINGNMSTQSQNVVIEDTLAPTIDCPIDDVIIGGDDAIDYLLEDFGGILTIADNCDEFTDLNITQDPAVGTALGNPSTTEITISATDLVGNTETCTFNLIVDQTLSINDTNLDPNAIRLFPNPVKDQLSLTSNGVMLKSVQIYDLTGRIFEDIIVDNARESQINLTQLKTGLYFIRIKTTTNDIVIKQFLKE